MAPKASEDNATLEKSKDGQMKIAKNEEKHSQKNHKSEDDNDSSTKKRTQSNDEKEEEPPKKAQKTENQVKEINDESLQPGKTESDQNDEGQFEILEQGILYFFYRPKVQSAEEVEKNGKSASSIDDIQNTHLLLVPAKSQSSNASAPSSNNKSQSNSDGTSYSGTTGEKARKEGVGFRLIRLGKKRMPAPEEAIENGLEPGGIGGDSSEAIWTVISDIGPDVNELVGSLGEKRYNTKTRGERFVGGSRLAGRGRYAIVFHNLQPASKSNVRLTYALSHPNEISDVQKQLGITLSASIRLSMRNPTLPQTGQGAPPAGLPKEDRVEMKKDELDEAFGGKVNDGGTRYTDPKNIEWLDREGVELLMTRERYQSKSKGAHTGASEDQANSLESKVKKEGKSLSIDDVMDELQLSNEQNPPDAIEGTWI